MKIGNFDLQQKVSNQVAFTTILVVGFFVAWITISVGKKIITGFSESAPLKMQKNYDLLEEKTPKQDTFLKK